MVKSPGEYVKVQEYLEKALSIRRKFGDREGEARDYGKLGSLFLSLDGDECAKPNERQNLAQNSAKHFHSNLLSEKVICANKHQTLLFNKFPRCPFTYHPINTFLLSIAGGRISTVCEKLGLDGTSLRKDHPLK